MTTNKASSLCRWAATAALLALTGCAAYPGDPTGYAAGYYDGPAYDGWYGYDGFGIDGWGGYPYDYHGYDHHWGHAGWGSHGSGVLHDGGAYPHFAWHRAPGGLHGGMGGLHGGFAHAAMGGHGGGGHGGARG
jgi:hypothetical protein